MRFVFPRILFGSFLALWCFHLTDGGLISKDRSGVFVQQLNHLNPEDGTFNQRYWYDKYFYERDGPVFLWISAESDPTTPGLPPLTMYHYYAAELNALCLLLEHRYYGESAPYAIKESNNHTAGTFKFLNSGQAIEDVGSFIQWMKTHSKQSSLGIDISPKSKWVVFGCSYGGTLAAWSKERFPDLIHAAVASSAPLEAKLDLYDFNKRRPRLRFHQGTPDDAWSYQQCTEFGWFGNGGTTRQEQAQWVYNKCSQFNEYITLNKLERAMSSTNQRTQGKLFYQPYVIFIHGEDDVWRPAGVSDPNPQTEKQMPVIIIPKAKHCEDAKFPPEPVRTANPNWAYPLDADFKKMRLDIRAAQDKVLGILRDWLK